MFIERKRRKLLEWLFPHSSPIMHEALIEKRVDGTCNWFLRGNRFTEFIASENCSGLLCFGIRTHPVFNFC